MSKTAHTPGPWCVGPLDDTRVEDAHGNCVAEIDGDYNQPETWPIMEANARLIAAAPDLLEALERLAGEMCNIACHAEDIHCHAVEMRISEIYGLVDPARAAIARAKGKA